MEWVDGVFSSLSTIGPKLIHKALIKHEWPLTRYSGAIWYLLDWREFHQSYPYHNQTECLQQEGKNKNIAASASPWTRQNGNYPWWYTIRSTLWSRHLDSESLVEIGKILHMKSCTNSIYKPSFSLLRSLYCSQRPTGFYIELNQTKPRKPTSFPHIWGTSSEHKITRAKASQL